MSIISMSFDMFRMLLKIIGAKIIGFYNYYCPENKFEKVPAVLMPK